MLQLTAVYFIPSIKKVKAIPCIQWQHKSWSINCHCLHTRYTAVVMGAVLQKLGFGGDEGGGDAAVKRQAEGLSNPMYQLANLMGQVNIQSKLSCLNFDSHS